MKTVAFAAIAGTVSATWAPAPTLTGDSFKCPTTGQDYTPSPDISELAKSLAQNAAATHQCKAALYAVKDIAHELMYSSSYHAPVAAPYPGSWHAPVGGSFGSWDVRNTRKFSRVNTRQANTRKNTRQANTRQNTKDFGSGIKVGGGAGYKNGGEDFKHGGDNKNGGADFKHGGDFKNGGADFKHGGDYKMGGDLRGQNGNRNGGNHNPPAAPAGHAPAPAPAGHAPAPAPAGHAPAPAPAGHAPAPAGPAGPHGRGLMWSAPSSYDAEYAMKQQAALQIKLAKAIGAAKVACGELAEELQEFGAGACPSYGVHSYSWAPSSGRMLGDAPVATAYSMTSPYGFSSVFEKCPKEIQSVPTATVACVVGLAEQSTPVLEALKGTQLFAAKIAQEVAMLAATPCKPVTLGATKEFTAPYSGSWHAPVGGSFGSWDVRNTRQVTRRNTRKQETRKQTNKKNSRKLNWEAPTYAIDCATRNCQLGQLQGKLSAALAQACALTAKLGAISEKFECFEAPTATYTAPWQPVAAPAPTYTSGGY